MESGQIFKVDAEAAKDVGKPELEGLEYSICKDSKVTTAITEVEVRASKWVDGKPSRGRPRRFSRSTVARLLGELDDPSLKVVEDEPVVDVSTEEELTGVAEQLLAEDTADSDEEVVITPSDVW